MKSVAKAFANWVAILMVLPIVAAFYAAAALTGRERVFAGFSQLVSLVPGYLGQYLRRAFYRLVLPECGPDVCVVFGTVLSHSTARLGARCYVGSFCVLGDVTLERDVLVGSNVSVINGNRQHGIEITDVPVREQPGVFPHVTIGADTWIGDRALVMYDVGKHAVVGAGSVVTKPVPDFAIVVGNPARIVGYRGQPGSQDSASPLTTAADTNAGESKPIVGSANGGR